MGDASFVNDTYEMKHIHIKLFTYLLTVYIYIYSYIYRHRDTSYIANSLLPEWNNTSAIKGIA